MAKDNPLLPENRFKPANFRADDFWRQNFKNAKKFFESKGSASTKSRLKKEWYEEFYEDLNETAKKWFKENQFRRPR